MTLRRLVSIATASILLVGNAALPSAASGPSGAASSERGLYIVQFTSGANVDTEVRAAKAAGLEVKNTIRNAFSGMVVEMNTAQARALKNNPRVSLVEADQEVKLSSTTQSPVTWGARSHRPAQ